MIERETEVDVTFHFMFHFSCFACCFKQTLPKTNRSFHFVALVQRFVARCCKMQCVHNAKQSGKVTVRITKVMAVRHFVSRSRLIAPKSLATF